MAAINTISVQQLSKLIGQPDIPALVDVRTEAERALDPRLVPGSVTRDAQSVGAWAREYAGRDVIAISRRGRTSGEGTAAWLRHEGIRAETLEGGFDAWVAQGGLLVRPDKLPPRDARGRTVWVTRARPKIDRIACPWLIWRFIDPAAVFLFVAPAEVDGVADRFGATPFDIDGAFWGHRGPLCTFDAMLTGFGLQSAALDRLAPIVRAADTGRPELAPEAAGLVAASLGLSRMFSDDLVQLEAGLTLYDAFYRWSRDAIGETHTYPAGHVTARFAPGKAP